MLATVRLGLCAWLVALAGCSSSEETPGSGGQGHGAGGSGGSATTSSSTASGGGGAHAGGGGSGPSGGAGGSGGHTGGSGGAAFTGRLFVTMADAAPAVWEDAVTLAADAAPSFTLTASALATGARGLALAGTRLFVGGETSPALLLAFDGAATLGAAAVPTAAVPSSGFIAAPGASQGADLITWDGTSNTVWATTFLAGTELFTGAGALTSGANAAALLSHAFQQLPAFAYDPTGGRAFAGQISGAGVLAWNGAASATGTPAASFTLASNIAAWSLAVAGSRLYAIGAISGPPQREVIAVWNAVASLSAATAPTFTLGTASGIATNDFSPDVGVYGDVLVACIQSGKVLLWTGAAALSGETAPTQTLSVPSSPLKAMIGPKSGRLYVLESNALSIYETPTTAPVLAARITNGVSSPRDFVVLE